VHYGSAAPWIRTSHGLSTCGNGVNRLVVDVLPRRLYQVQQFPSVGIRESIGRGIHALADRIGIHVRYIRTSSNSDVDKVPVPAATICAAVSVTLTTHA